MLNLKKSSWVLCALMVASSLTYAKTDKSLSESGLTHKGLNNQTKVAVEELKVAADEMKDKANEASSLLNSKVSVHNAWRRHGLGTFEKYSKLEPIVEENIIYVPSAMGKVVALDKVKGTKLWEIKLNEKLIAGPTLSNGKLYLGTKSAKVISIDVATHKVDWQQELSNVMSAAPTVENNKVIVQTVDGKLIAYDRESKQMKWIYERSMPTLILRGGSQPVISQNTVISGFANGRLVALDLETGSILWERAVAESTGQSEIKRLNDIASDPIVIDNQIYVVTYQGKVAALDLQDGSMLWSSNMSSYQNIAVDGDKLFISDTDHSVWALDRMSGQVLWTQKTFKHALTGPTLVSNFVVVGDEHGSLHWLSKQDGRILASKRVRGGAFEKSPIAYHSINGVITTQLDGKLAAYLIHQEK